MSMTYSNDVKDDNLYEIKEQKGSIETASYRA